MPRQTATQIADRVLRRLEISTEELNQHHHAKSEEPGTLHALGVGASLWVATQVAQYIQKNSLEIAFKAGKKTTEWLLENWHDTMHDWSDLAENLDADFVSEVLVLSAEAADVGLDGLEMMADVAEVASDGIDIFESVATLGLSVGVGWLVSKGFEAINEEEETQLQALQEKINGKQNLAFLARHGAPPAKLLEQMVSVEKKHWELL